MKKIIFYLLIIFTLIGCATKPPTYDNSMFSKIVTVEPEPIVKTIEKVNYIFVDKNAKEIELKHEEKTEKITPEELITRANKNSEIKVVDETYLQDNIVVYPYKDGAVFDLITTPSNVTDLRLEANEEVTGQPAIGDPSRWEISAVNSVENNKNIQHFFISPLSVGLKTTMIIPTNKRTYYFNLYSTKSTNMIAVKFNYYTDKKINMPKSYPITHYNLEDLDFNYEIASTKGEPMWKPVAVFSDDEHTYIDLGNLFDITAGAPNLYYTRGWRKPPEMINSRLMGSLYIVDFVLTENDYFLLKENNDEILISRRL